MELITRLLARLAALNRHNSYDAECVRWFGDRSPARNRNVRGGWKPVPIQLRNMNGSPTLTVENRCPVCNPYTGLEDLALLGWEAPDSHQWIGSILVATGPFGDSAKDALPIGTGKS